MILTTRKQEICNIIETLPEELANKVIDYIEYLKFTVVTSHEDDLREKLQKGIEASDSGKAHSVEGVFDKIDKILVN